MFVSASHPVVTSVSLISLLLCHLDGIDASNSWSTNVLGVKKWTLFPPHVAHCLRRSGSVSPAAEMVDDVGTLASGSVDEKIFPQWKQAWDARIEVTQSAGESIFVCVPIDASLGSPSNVR